jgi:hypothetical protein
VGLVQRHLEASGLSTVTLSWMPELTRRVGVPRLAGISYPLSRPLGRPQDANGQRAVLRATLALLESATAPDHYVELPFAWPETVSQARNASKDVPPSPIAALLAREPWLIPKLYLGRINRG